jgi:hypothetical protein
VGCPFTDKIKADVPINQAKKVIGWNQLLQRHHLQFILGGGGRS